MTKENRNIGTSGRSRASFLGLFLGATDTSSLDQGGEMRKRCAEGHEWVLEKTLGIEINLKAGWGYYLQQIMCGCTLLGINLECKMEEFTEDGGQVVFIFDGRRAIGGDEVKGSQWRFRQVWGLALDHLDGHDTQTPNVNFAAILLTSNNFRGHPIWSSNHGVALILRVVDLGTETEIS